MRLTKLLSYQSLSFLVGGICALSPAILFRVRHGSLLKCSGGSVLAAIRTSFSRRNCCSRQFLEVFSVSQYPLKTTCSRIIGRMQLNLQA